ncbi:MAG: hypothetical protein AAF560_25465 [Acidobacteriota bacterium]
MIAPLRRRHRWMTAILAVVVLGLYVAALAGRPAAPRTSELPAARVEPAGEVVAEYDDLFRHPITTRVRSSAAGWQLELTPSQPLAKPEVLVYWTSEGETGGPGLPADAFLLGALAGARPRTMTLPAAAQGRPGQLLLYSLGHQEIVDSGTLPAHGDAAIESTLAAPIDESAVEVTGEEEAR